MRCSSTAAGCRHRPPSFAYSLAGHFASREPVKLRLAPVRPAVDGVLPMTFAISMGVRKGDSALKQKLERELARRHDAIMAILAAYHVPVLSAVDPVARLSQ